MLLGSDAVPILSKSQDVNFFKLNKQFLRWLKTGAP